MYIDNVFQDDRPKTLLKITQQLTGLRITVVDVVNAMPLIKKGKLVDPNKLSRLIT